MITGLIVTAVLASLNSLTSLIPPVPIPTTTAGTIGSIASTINHVFPVAIAATVILAYLLVEGAMHLWNFVVFVYHQFWGSS